MKGQEWYQADDIADAYEDKRFSRGGRLIDRREKEAVLSAIGPVEDKKVLEIACGTGRFTVMLAERGADVVGLDVSVPMLSQGRRKARSAGVEDNLEFIRGDAGGLPFPDDSFDAVFAIRFFHLADTPADFMSEMRRVSRDQVFFDTFNASSARIAYNWLLPMGSHLYSRRDVSQLLGEVDLTLENGTHDFIVPYGVYRSIPGAIAEPLRKLDIAVGRTPAGPLLASVSYWNAHV